jgi:hypothetical protein
MGFPMTPSPMNPMVSLSAISGVYVLTIRDRAPLSPG